MKNKIIKHIFKIVLALALVISASVFIQQDVNACPGDGCTCAPWLSTDGEDHRGACATTWMSCDFYCNGHWYPEGFQMIEWDDGHDANLAGSWHWHHVYVWAHCAWCGQNPDYQIDTFVWDHRHNWKKPDELGHWALYRPNNEPCQIWYNNYIMCPDCGAIIDTDDTSLGWYHNQGVHWKETDVKGDRTYHALWCNRHGWVNSDDCENHPQSSGSYAGLWYGVDTTSGTLKYYYHNLSPNNYGDSMHYECTD